MDTLNILLYDDSTHSYFSLANLKGLLEVLTEHLRHCLMQMFSDFDDLEEGHCRPHRHPKDKRSNGLKSLSSSSPRETKARSGSVGKPNANMQDEEDESCPAFLLPGANYTMVSRKGLPVKIDPNPHDSSVLEGKEWDVFTHFQMTKDVWACGGGDITDHIFTHFESQHTNDILSRKFKKRRTCVLNEGSSDEEEEDMDEKKKIDGEKCADEFLVEGEKSKSAQQDSTNSSRCFGKSQNSDGSNFGAINSHNSDNISSSGVSKSSNSSELSNTVDSLKSKELLESSEKAADSKDTVSTLNSNHSHSKMCNGEDKADPKLPDLTLVKTELVDIEMTSNETSSNVVEVKEEAELELKENGDILIEKKQMEEVKNVKGNKDDVDKTIKPNQPLENGDLNEPKLSPMVNHKDTDDGKFCNGLNEKDTTSDKEKDEDDDSSPPVLEAEGGEVDMDNAAEADTLPLDDICSQEAKEEVGEDTEEKMEVDSIEREDASQKAKTENETEEETIGENEEVKSAKESESAAINCKKEKESTDHCGRNSGVSALIINTESETEVLSSNYVANLLKKVENVEDEAFLRDDPPLCVTVESRDELGRRCVCISNIIRSLSCVPGNEARICKHPGIMRILGRLLLLHHTHPQRPAPRRLPSGDDDEEEKEEPPRVCDDDHWWWDYLDQLRENVLVILANICSHLMLINFPEQLCLPLLEGLLHWAVCPSSVARDPLPTLGSGSTLSPQRLVLEALCKLCIHETNVDLLLATPPLKRLLEFLNILVRLLADRQTQITREFAIVILSLLVQGDSSVARAIALQHPCIPLLVDFLETAEQNALAIANQQGLAALQNNPEAMGTSLDMLRRSAAILLNIAKVPDNRKMFVPQQNRLLNLVMSEILDQSVANTLSEVLFECSQSCS